MAVTTVRSENQSEGDSANELHERASELATLDACFERAKRGDGNSVFVGGAAGTGKTSLVHAFLASIDVESQPLVLAGGCDDLIVPRAFGPFRDMASTTGLLADELVTDPNLEDLLAGLLSLLTRPNRPAVVVVEDAHWADDASIDVMRFLSRRLISLHAMLIVTAREPETSGANAVSGLFAGSSSSAPTRLNLGPLSLDAVKAMCAGSALNAKLDAPHLHQISGGNPLLIRRLLAADPEDATRLARRNLMTGVERLSTDGRAVLQTLAVLPDGADPTLARILFADRPASLHEAETSGLLASSTDHIRFQSELAKTAVAEAMSFGERMAATDSVLAALTETGTDPMALVHIARAAGDGQRATALAVDALDHRLSANDYHEMWTLARIGLECTSELSSQRIASLHTVAASAGRTIGRHAEALGHAERAVQLRSKDTSTDGREPDDQRMLASAWMALADLQGDGGDHLRARTSIRTAKNLLESDTESREWTQAVIRQAAAQLRGGDRGRSVELASAGIAQAEANGWHGEAINGLCVRGVAYGSSQTAEGAADLDRAVELGAIHGPPEQYLSALLEQAAGHLQNAETAEAELLTGEVERECQEHGLDRLRFRAGVLLAQVFLVRGRTAEAERLATKLAAAEVDPGASKALAEAVIARIRVRRADEGAGDLVDQVWNAAVKTGEIEMLAFTGISRLEHRWIEGDEDGLRQYARYLAGLGERHDHHRLRAEALRALQRIGDAPALGDEPGRIFDGCPGPFVSSLAGDHLRAAELWEQAGEPFARALELVEAKEAAVAFEGLRLLDRTGASRIADLARHRLRGRGLQGVPRGPRQSANGSVPVLTGRQLEVLRLIARGRTNAQIADELFVARRTVDNHVSAILSRLDVDGRTQAVETAISRQLIER